MTELEARLLDMLNQEKREAEQEREEVARERKELAYTLQSIARQQQQIIELLQKPTGSDSLETTLQRVLNGFQVSLIESLTKSLKVLKS
jgi:hypothetical protein